MPLLKLGILVFCLVFSQVVVAEDEIGAMNQVDEKAADDTTAEARQAFALGNELFSSGSFAPAADQYRRANELQPNWKIYYNIGQSEAAAKRPGLALQAFERYLALGGDDVSSERVDEVTGEVTRLRGQVGLLVIKAKAGAIVLVDGVVRGTAPLAGAVPVAASVEHVISIEGGDDQVSSRSVIVLGGQEREVEMAAAKPVESSSVAAVPPVASTPEKAVAQVDDSSASSPVSAERIERAYRFTRMGRVAAVAGTMFLLAGGITGVLTAKKDGQLLDSCDDDFVCTKSSDRDLATQVDRLGVTTDILLPTGGAFLVAGVVMMVRGRKLSRDERARAVPRLMVGRNGVTVGLRGRF